MFWESNNRGGGAFFTVSSAYFRLSSSSSSWLTLAVRMEASTQTVRESCRRNNEGLTRGGGNVVLLPFGVFLLSASTARFLFSLSVLYPLSTTTLTLYSRCRLQLCCQMIKLPRHEGDRP